MQSNRSKANFDPKQLSPEQVFSVAIGAFAVLVIVYIAFSGLFTVRETEKAVILRFGKYHRTVGPGLHFKIPWIDQRILVDTSENSIRFTSGHTDHGSSRRQDFNDHESGEETLFLTGDLYASVVEWNVNWRVDSPEKYLFSIQAEDVDDTISAVSRSVMHRTVGDYSADETLTGKREEITLSALRETKAMLNSLDCGVEIIDLQLQRITPPLRVKPAFDDVNASIQERDKLVNSARKERNSLIPKANAAADKLIREAEGYAARRRAETEGEISALLAKFESYRLAPEVTRKRLYLETMERVLTNSGPKVILDDQLKSVLPLLPLSVDK